MSIATDLCRDRHEVPIRPESRIKAVQMNEGRSMSITQASGEVLTISKDDELIQAFAIYSILAEL